LQRFEDAKRAVEEAHALKVDDWQLHTELYEIAFVAGDVKGMEAEERWFETNPGYAYGMDATLSDTQAYYGRLQKARQLTARAVQHAVEADSKESAGQYMETAALREAGFGNAKEAREAAVAGLKLAPEAQGVLVQAALAYAMAGDVTHAQ